MAPPAKNWISEAQPDSLHLIIPHLSLCWKRTRSHWRINNGENTTLWPAFIQSDYSPVFSKVKDDTGQYTDNAFTPFWRLFKELPPTQLARFHGRNSGVVLQARDRWRLHCKNSYHIGSENLLGGAWGLVHRRMLQHQKPPQWAEEEQQTSISTRLLQLASVRTVSVGFFFCSFKFTNTFTDMKSELMTVG